jgi:hypothetical protein
MYAAADKGGAYLDAIGQTDSCLRTFLSRLCMIQIMNILI